MIDIKIDNEQTFGEFRSKVSSSVGIAANNFLLVGKNEYDYAYNSKKIREINDIDDHSTLFAVYSVGRGIKGI